LTRARKSRCIVPVRVLQKQGLVNRGGVYNLAVEDANEYFANGVLVHNCDAMASWVFLRAQR
jgi:hypothetical protein